MRGFLALLACATPVVAFRALGTSTRASPSCGKPSSSWVIPRMAISDGAVARVDFRLVESESRKPFLDTTFDQGKIKVQVGAGGYIPDLHAALKGMTGNPGETLTVPNLKLFGEYNADLAAELPWDQIPSEKLEEGTTLRLWNGMSARVTKIDMGKSFTIDANPPNAGKVLDLEIELLEAPIDGEDALEEIVVAGGCFWGKRSTPCIL